MKYDILTIGSGTRDVFLQSEHFKVIRSKLFASGLGECVSLGSKIEIDRILLTTGGGATNAAVTFSRLGYRTATVCRIGDDNPGDAVLADLVKEGVETTLVSRVPGGQTGYSTILTEPKGERSILVARGVSSTFTQKDIPLKSCQMGRWIYLTSLGGNMALAKKIASHANKCRNRLMWNPGSRELARGFRALQPMLKMVDVINMNLEEAFTLTKTKSIKQISSFLSTGKNVVLITDGPRGVWAFHNGHSLHAGTTGAPSISRTGAGDAFGSGFLASWMKTPDLGRALAVGTLNAESVIRKHGAKNGILSSWPSEAKIRTIPLSSI